MIDGRRPSGIARVIGRAAASLNEMIPRVWAKAYSLALAGSFAAFGPRTVIRPPFEINRPDLVEIGAGTVVGARTKFLLMTRVQGNSPCIVIGDQVAVGAFCFFSAADRIEIGDGTMVSRGVYISDHNHRYDRTDVHIRDQGTDSPKAVSIGSGAWIGEHAVIMPGAQLGDGCVVGANAVVSGNVPAYSLALGNPARVLRNWSPDAAPDSPAEAQL